MFLFLIFILHKPDTDSSQWKEKFAFVVHCFLFGVNKWLYIYRAKFHNQGFTLSVHPNVCLPNVK